MLTFSSWILTNDTSVFSIHGPTISVRIIALMILINIGIGIALINIGNSVEGLGRSFGS